MPISKSAVPAVAVVPTPIDPSQILTLEEVAERLKVTPRFVYEKTRRTSPNPIPVMRIGRFLRFHWPEVSDWLSRSGGASRR